mgnify:FL=1
MKSTAFDMAMVAYRQNDMESAFRQFLSLAEAQDADAMNMVANMFERARAHTEIPGEQCFGGRKRWSLEMWMHLPITDSYLVATFF